MRSRKRWRRRRRRRKRTTTTTTRCSMHSKYLYLKKNFIHSQSKCRHAMVHKSRNIASMRGRSTHTHNRNI